MPDFFIYNFCEKGKINFYNLSKKLTLLMKLWNNIKILTSVFIRFITFHVQSHVFNR